MPSSSKNPPRSQSIALVSYLVREYGEAIEFFVQKLGFSLVEDTDMGAGKRWVVVSPPNSHGSALLLARAATPQQLASVGNQTGGRVFLFLHTDNFHRDHAAMRAHSIRFLESPRIESYGTVAVFEDLYGNKWDLLEPAALQTK
ncbi:MAG TPA: VOC family protein [Candidatus Acidoferrum sp.]|nr:VOC family protein [Candidatus Acidoferrum sp.]